MTEKIPAEQLIREMIESVSPEADSEAVRDAARVVSDIGLNRRPGQWEVERLRQTFDRLTPVLSAESRAPEVTATNPARANGQRLLLVEDDNHVAATLSAVLRQHGFHVTHARGGEEALQALGQEGGGFGVVLLDLGLSGEDGYELCGKIRRRTSAPVIMVTARSDVRSRIHGLALGADDYVLESYDAGEFFARIHAISRRTAHEDVPGGADTALVIGAVRIELPTRRVTVDGREVPLTRKEFDVLALLAQRPGRVFRREQIISEVWRTSGEGTSRTLEVHVASLRWKLGAPELIETVRGVGYRLVAPAV